MSNKITEEQYREIISTCENNSGYDNMDLEDFKDLDTYLHSEEFSEAYNNAIYQPTGKSWSGKYIDYSGMTIEDFGR